MVVDYAGFDTYDLCACVKAALDVAIGRDPVFLGPHEAGADDALRD